MCLVRFETQIDVLGAETVPVGPGLVILSPVQVKLCDLNGLDVTVRVEPQNGRLVATELNVEQRDGGPAVTVERIRSLPIAFMVREAAVHLSEVEPREDGVFEITSREVTPELVAELVSEGPTDRTLGTVAYIYRYANAIGVPPAKLVDTTFQLSRSKGGRWIALARQRGFLGPAEVPGKASV